MFCGEISYPWPPFLLGGRDRQGVVLSGYLPEMLFCRLRCLDLGLEHQGIEDPLGIALFITIETRNWGGANQRASCL